ncbi:MAG: hypothetical protein P8N76_22370 [Pirellulaceae bacterium]|nr:hypothetical protein [Pirellulaceae bacterium]
MMSRVRKISNLSRLTAVIILLCQALGGVADEVTDCVLIQPIVVRGDDGTAPAHFRIADALIDQVYRSADLTFHFLEPRYYDSEEARNGEINLDQIVERTEKSGVLKRVGEQINMLFVNKVDGKSGPLGRAQTPGSIVFIALTEKERELGEDAFVVAHESGHNLGLQHAVDDDKVPNDVPNLMGDGPFLERLGPRGLTEYQIKIIRENPLVQPRIDFLEGDRAKQAVLDESYESYFGRLHRREIATLTGEALESGTLEEDRETARNRFRDAIRSFSEREKESITWVVKELEERLEIKFPLLWQQPWKFIKVRSGLCGNFSHTRGPCIIFSQSTVDRIVAARNSGSTEQALLDVGTLFLHEQLHVLQRLYPRKFAKLYRETFGLMEAEVVPHPWIEERLMTNPDASGSTWLIRDSDAPDVPAATCYWPLTILKGDEEVPVMGRDFRSIAVEVEDDGSGRFSVVCTPQGIPKFRDLESLQNHARRFPTVRGLEHPNEIAAYMFADKLRADLSADQDVSVTKQQRQMVLDFQHWCEQQLR